MGLEIWMWATIIMVWFFMGFVGFVWDITAIRSVTVKDVALMVALSFFGPVVIILHWFSKNQEKIIFKKRK